MKRFAVTIAAVGLLFGLSCLFPQHGRAEKRPQSAAEKADDARAIFQRRILPIMNSPKQSSCTECHLAGVELKDYIHSDQATTFAALRKAGLIDVKQPEKSKILTFIARKPQKPNPITDKMRQRELAAFTAWLKAAAKDPKLLKAAAGDKGIGTKLPPEVIRHARKDRVLSSFLDNVWSQMGRCISCHSPSKKNARLVKKFGEQMNWVVPHNPKATLKNLVEAGNIDTDNPAHSRLLTKPAGLEKHGGGPKFLPGGPAHRGFLRFCKDYAAIVNGKYKSKNDLPKPPEEVVLLGKQFLRIHGMPAGWHRLPMRVDVYRWNAKQKRWSAHRWATAFGPVAGKRHMWQNIFAVTAPRGSAREKEIRHKKLLPAGRYVAKLYLDRKRKTKKDPHYELGSKEFVGQVEFHGEWPTGFRTPKTVRVKELKRAK